MHAEDLRFYQLAQQQTLHRYHRFVLRQSSNRKLVLEDALWVCDEGEVQPRQVVAARSDSLGSINRVVKSIFGYSELPEADLLEGGAQEEEEAGEHPQDDETGNQNFPPVLHLN